MKYWSLLLIFLVVQHTAVVAANSPTRVPGIQSGATIFLEGSDDWSSVVERFGEELQSVISRTDKKHDRIRPGLRVVNNKAAADYILHYVVVAGERPLACAGLGWVGCLYPYIQGNLRATVLLLSSDGTELWEAEYDCAEPLAGISAEVCADRLANDLKAAQVDKQGKRAGAHGWKTLP
jgi:hypothetical protein